MARFTRIIIRLKESDKVDNSRANNARLIVLDERCRTGQNTPDRLSLRRGQLNQHGRGYHGW